MPGQPNGCGLALHSPAFPRAPMATLVLGRQIAAMRPCRAVCEQNFRSRMAPGPGAFRRALRPWSMATLFNRRSAGRAGWASTSGERGQQLVVRDDRADPARQVGLHRQGLQFLGGSGICSHCVDSGFGLHGSLLETVRRNGWLMTGQKETLNIPTISPGIVDVRSAMPTQALVRPPIGRHRTNLIGSEGGDLVFRVQTSETDVHLAWTPVM